MRIRQDIVSASSARISRRYGTLLDKPPLLSTPAPMDPERWARVSTYVNANRVPDDINALERAIGTNDLLSLHYFWAGLEAAQPVARVVIAATPGDPGGVATGFMIAPHLFMTNHHVFESAEIARRSRAQFAYESDAAGNERIPTSFSFLPDQFFITDEALDYTIVAIDPASQQGPDPLDSFGWLRLNPQLGKTDYGQYLSIIQHPGGETKQIAIRENQLLPFDDGDNFLTYRSDTFRGSSGSPVFNDLWDVVALHHSGKPAMDGNGHYIGHDGRPILDHTPQEHEIKWIANEGARASRIVADALRQAPQGAARDELEKAFSGAIQPAVPKLIAPAKPDREVSPQTITLPAANVPDRGFTVTLPFNVSLKVETLDRAAPAPPPAAPPASPPAPAPKPPAEAIVFEALNFDTQYSDRRGYDENFLGRDFAADMPTIAQGHADDIAPLLHGNKKVLHYHHYSAMVHAKRRMPVLTACNVDYRSASRDKRDRKAFGKDEWIFDKRMDEKYQIPQGFYDRWKKIDYGHLVRREDNCWGSSAQEIEFSNADTFHMTNCTPQHEDFNRAVFQYHGLWGEVENFIAKQASTDRTIARLSIFAGPIFNDAKDLHCRDEAGLILVPLAFWKVVVAPTSAGVLRAYGFVLSQEQNLADAPPFEDFVPTKFKHEQTSLAKIEAQTIIRFSKALKDADIMTTHPDGHEQLTLSTVDEIWTGQR